MGVKRNSNPHIGVFQVGLDLNIPKVFRQEP